STGHSPVLEYHAVLDRASILLAQGLVHEALANVETAREILSDPGDALRARADELEARARLTLGDVRSAVRLADGRTPPARGLLLATVALACGDPGAAKDHLDSMSAGATTPRETLTRALLLAALAIERVDPAAESMMVVALGEARRGGFCNTV